MVTLKMYIFESYFIPYTVEEKLHDSKTRVKILLGNLRASLSSRRCLNQTFFVPKKM